MTSHCGVKRSAYGLRGSKGDSTDLRFGISPADLRRTVGACGGPYDRFPDDYGL